jgi:nucleotide-binding universal stress UspA family protein
MIMNTEAPIVVGVDGSARSLEAVDVAAVEAVHRKRPLHILYVIPAVAAPDREGGESAAEAITWEAQLRAEKWGPRLDIRTDVIAGSPSAILLERSRGAAMVVVGDRGGGGFADLLTGSTALHLASNATCPVLIVHRRPPRRGPVVAGVDDHPEARFLVAAAAEEAALRRTDLVVVHAWRLPPVVAVGGVMSAGYDINVVESAAADVLTAALAGLPGGRPRIPVRHELVHGAAGPVLVDWSRDAQLVVVGDRGRGAFAGLLLGSVSQHVIDRAQSPVLVRRLRHPS